MGPAFLDLKVMCQCLARAIKKHLSFSKDTYLFLEDLQADDAKALEFSYKFKRDLKLTDKGREVMGAGAADYISFEDLKNNISA